MAAHQPKRVLITGGMSGIGHYLARMYAAAGCDIVLLDQGCKEEQRIAVESRRQQAGQRVRAYVADVCDNAAVQAAVDQSVQDIGTPDLVIHCAGIQRATTFDKLDPAEYELVVRINLFGSRNVAAAALCHMQSGSQIAFISSMAGLVSSFSYASYCSSKFGIVGLANVLRVEYKPQGIDVSVICPPEVMTPMVVKELETMHPVTRGLKDLAGTLSLEEVCTEIVSQLARRQFMVIPGTKARMLYRVSRLLPDWVLHKVTDSKVRKIMGAR